MKNFLLKQRWTLLAVTVLLMVTMQFPTIWSIFQQSAADTYGISLTESAMLFPMCVVFFSIFSIIGGRLQDSFDPRIIALVGGTFISLGIFSLSLFGKTSIYMLYLCFALPYGGGYGLLSPSIMTPLMKWYADKKGFAIGLSGALSSLFIVGETYLSRFLLVEWGMKSSVRAYGIVYFVLTLLCAGFL